MPDSVSLSGRSLIVASEKGFPFRDLEDRLYVAGMWREVEIVNKLGLHARPAARCVRWVSRFKSTITFRKGEEKFSSGESSGDSKRLPVK
jgi:PTS HPr component phosphorylation site